MEAVKVKVSTKGRVVIPKKFREKFGLEPGTEVMFVERDGSLTIVKVPRDPVEEGFGILKHLGGPPLTQEIIEEHRREREREERKIERLFRS